MGNAKRFLSVILAIIMMCSTLVIGANAAYTAYKDSAILGQYNKLDKAVLTTEQYASAAMDEVDRMLTKEQMKFTREDIIVGDIDLTSIDAAMDSVYTLVHGALFSSLKGMLGDLQNLNVDAFAPEPNGVRRGTAGKTDVDIVYAVLQFLHDNTDLLVSFVEGTLDTGSILSSLVDLSEFMDVNKLLKGLLYEFAYGVEGTDEQVAASSVDSMAQNLIDKYIVTGYDEELDDGTIEHVEGLVPALEGKTNISTGTTYQFLDNVLKVLYNELVLPLLNEDLKPTIGELCGVIYTENEETGEVTEDRSQLNGYANLLNLDYTVSPFEFTSATLISQLNNLLKSVLDELVNPDVFVWQAGDNSMVKENITNMAKALLVNTGDDLFADYIEVATPEEVEAMTSEELVIYAARAIVNGSAYGMYVPEVSTLREFAFVALQQVLATDIPELDFSSLDKNSTDSLVIMGINYAIYAVSSELDMGLEFVYDMDGVDAQIKKAMNYAIDNYAGLLNGVTLDENASGWENLNTLIFSIIPANWLPASVKGDIKTFIFDLANTIADLDFDALFALFEYRADSELQKAPKTVIINLVTRVVNIIFPGAFATGKTTLDSLVTNQALAGTVRAIFNALWNYRANLVAAILPTLCGILDLTNDQEFEFPELTWDPTDANVNGNSISTAGSIALKLMVRNGSTGINTGYTDANGVFHQDKLYTYDIKGVTTNIAALNVTYPDTIAGGQTAEFSFTGSVSASTVFVVTMTYDVLTEDGTPLTDEPITETMYSYIACNEADDSETAATSTVSGGYSITDGPKNYYANSFGDLTDITLTVKNTNAAEAEVIPHQVNGLNKLVTKDGASYLQLVTDPVTIMQQVDDTAGIANIQVFEETEAYNALTGEEKDAVWDSMIEANTTYNTNTGAIARYPLITYTLGAKIGSTTLTSANCKLFIYDDFGLPGLLEDEMGKHRQQSAYASAESTVTAGSTVWEAYVAAMEAAAKAVYSPFRNGTFALANARGKAVLYETAYNNLTAAIEELDAQVLSAGVESSQELIDKCFPSNPEDIPYYDPSYVHSGVIDYVGYTYYNFRDELRTLQAMIDSATIPDEETGEVAVVNELTKAYNEHRFSLYYGRLLTVDTVKTHLERELANPTREIGDASEYDEVAWNDYEIAVNFATSTINEATANPSKVKSAYRALLEAEKRLVAPTEGGDVGGDEASYEFTETVVLVEGVETGELFITGINPDNDLADYFVCSGCYVEVTENEGGYYSTGAVVTVKSDADDSVLAAYTVAVYTDITGDGMTDTSEVSQVLVFTAGSDVPSDLGLAAGDVNFDGAIDTSDLSSYLAVAAGSVVVNYETREIA